MAGRKLSFNIYIPFKDEMKQLRVLVKSDRWISDPEFEYTYISLDELGIKMDKMAFTPLLRLQPLPVTAIPEKYRALYSFKYFNPIQTQLFHILLHTNENVLVGAPTGSGKTIMAELALLRMLEGPPGGKCVYVAPLKSLAKERIHDWKRRLESEAVQCPVV